MSDRDIDNMIAADVPSGAVSGVSGVTEAFFSNYSLLGQSECFVFYKARRYGRWYVLKGLKKGQEMGPYAFAYCDSLRVVRMGRNVRRIDSYCFTECPNMRNVVALSPAPPEVQPTTFNQLPPDAVLYVPAASVEAYRKHPVWGKFATIVGTEK